MADTQRNTFAVIVDDEPGVLARVIGLFSGRGYNIESLTVAQVETEANRSRITLVTSGTPMVIEQIEAQLGRLVPTHKVCNLTRAGASVERELALVKVRGIGIDRIETMRIAEIFRARAVDTKTDSFVFEITGNSDKVTAFIDLMRPLGLIEIARTGVARPQPRRRGTIGFRRKISTAATSPPLPRGSWPGRDRSRWGRKRQPAIWPAGDRPPRSY